MPVGRRRFPPPWDIEEHDQSCFIVRDDNGQALAYVYFESEPADAPQQTYSHAMRHGALRPTSPDCHSYWVWSSQ